MMKSCELCKSPARIYCESDQASLCWTCDTKVHSANFLVARHARTLLCRTCQCQTPWSASGQKIGPSTVSVCHKCGEDDENDATESVASDDDEDDDDVSESEDDDEGEDDENQVVPWCSTTPPPAASSSGSDDEDDDGGDGDGDRYVKRKRDNAPDLSSEDDETGCSSVRKVRRETTFCDGSPSNSEKISGEKVVVGGCKATRGLGLDLNL